ncbi:MAG: MBL fold metallo-hydrolase [Actinomycetota bacterium]
MRLWIAGVRGSTPAPGPEFVRFGGNTSCVALGDVGGPPTLVLDGGTGLGRLAREFMDGQPFRGTILLGHLHWDHTHGLPFFPAGDRPDSRVRVYMPAQGDPEEVLARAMSPPHFPVRATELRGDWRVSSLEAGERKIEGFSVLALDIPHKGGRMFGFRVTDGASTITYMSDHHPIQLGPGPTGHGEYHEAAYTLCEDTDLLIHDAQYTVEEFPARVEFGHSTFDYAVGLAETARARRLLLFHHDPPRTDDQLDAILASIGPKPFPIGGAAEGTVIDLP